MYLHVVSEVRLEDPADHVVADVVPGVAHVAVGVDGGAACVPLDGVAVAGDEFFLGEGRGTSSLVRLFLSLRTGWFMEVVTKL